MLRVNRYIWGREKKWATLESCPQRDPKPCDNCHFKVRSEQAVSFQLTRPSARRAPIRWGLVIGSFSVSGFGNQERPYCPRPPWQLPNHVTLHLNTQGHSPELTAP